MNHTQLCNADFVICIRSTSLRHRREEELCIRVLYRVDINVRSVQRSVFVALLATKALSIILEFSFHDPTDGHNVTTYASVNQVILDLAVDGLWKLSRIDILHVVFYLLNPNPLIEGSFCSVLLRVEDPAPTVYHDALVGCLPLAINEVHNNLGLAIVTLKLNGLNQDLDRANS